MLNFYRLQQDYLKFEGADRLDLINRLSTNEVNSLEKYMGIKTILTSDKGRFVDIVTLYNFGDFVFAACSFNNSKNVIAYLDKYTIMDDFKPVDMSGTHETILFYGDEVSSFASELFNIDTGNFENDDFSVYASDDKDSIIARNDDAFGLILSMHQDRSFGRKILNKDLK
jgi:folate-binding Fe-S cluster repair protein YgfZ